MSRTCIIVHIFLCCRNTHIQSRTETKTLEESCASVTPCELNMKKETNVTCLYCSKNFYKRNSEIEKYGNNFCSRSCSCSYNNTIVKKRELQGKCFCCNIKISSSRKFCNDCIKNKIKKCTECGVKCRGSKCRNCYIENKGVENVTQLINNSISYKCSQCNGSCSKNSTICRKCHNYNKIKNEKLSDVICKNIHKSSAFAKIRTRARSIAKKLCWNSCRFCGYNKHIEVAHIKPIGLFNDDSLVLEINHIDNLIPLCPNCHWEFDNNQKIKENEPAK